MNTNKLFIIIGLIISALILTGCQNSKFGQKYNKPFKHNTPLIKEDIKKLKKAEIDETVRMGPKPVFGNIKELQKRKKISSQEQVNYLKIPDDYTNLKQMITLKIQNLDYQEAMKLMGKIGNINVLVGDEVAGSITAEMIEVPWDKAFQALLDMKNYAADIDAQNNLIKILTPANLTKIEKYKVTRAKQSADKTILEAAAEPIISEIYRLYYITPAQAKKTISELFPDIAITEEETTRSIIVRGLEKTLDNVDKVIREIDVRTKQVLIEAFIVEASSTFESALGTRLGGYYQKYGTVAGGVAGPSSGSKAGAKLGEAAGLGAATDSITSFPAAGATSGLGILRKTTTGVLKVEITALEAMGVGKILSNPKVFTLDNQLATITQGEDIPYQTTKDGTVTTSFKSAALELQVIPSIIGDGNVLLNIKVMNDEPNRAVGGDEPPIRKMQIATKLLVADGDIVVIGGIKKDTRSDKTNQTPGIGNVPVIGNLFKGKGKTDKLNELLVFIAPRIL